MNIESLMISEVGCRLGTTKLAGRNEREAID